MGSFIHPEILEVNLFAFAYKLFHEDFSPLDCALLLNPLPGMSGEKSL